MSIQIEEGKFYRTRGGSRVGPIVRANTSIHGFEWTSADNPDGPTWDGVGRYLISKETAIDLIAEAPDPSAPVTDTHAIETVEGPQIADTPEWAKGVEAEASVEYAVGDAVEESAEQQVQRMVFGEQRFYEPRTEKLDGESIDRMRAVADEFSIDRTAFDAAHPDIKTTIADEAKRIVSGARRSAYGKPEQNFERISAFWTAYAKAKGWPIEFTAADVSPMMRLMKEARLVESPGHYDSFVDLVGYTLTGAEVNGVTPPTKSA